MTTRTTNHYARFIPSEEIDGQAVRQWRFESVEHSRSGNGAALLPELDTLQDLLAPQPPVVPPEMEMPLDEQVVQVPEEEVLERLELTRQDAHAAGYQQGLELGHSQGQQEGQQQAAAEWQQKLQDYQAQQGQQIAQQLQGVLQSAQREVQNMQQRMAPDVLQLACDIARQVVRQELRSNPQALLPVVREALDMMSAESKPATVRLNPQDWAQLQTTLKAEFPQPKIEWLVDASVAPGDCKVESAGAQVDGSLERRWQRAVAALGLVSTWYDGAPHGQ
ncbi:FliH/SctL family protein [Comamonas sp. GB3 AK4-5]|uniref:FliH/SctL family protein n=1 Tax=Comamonas sp. GB3 AK4-5 TaxID=3231487 RepID=UPI00351E3402